MISGLQGRRMSLDSTRDLSDSSDDDSCRGPRSKHRNYRSVEQVKIFVLVHTFSPNRFVSRENVNICLLKFF